MRSRFRTCLLIGTAAHALLFALVGALYVPDLGRDKGASLIAVQLLAEEPVPTPGPRGKVEVRHAWLPREAAISPSRSPATQPMASRAPAPAAKASPRLAPRASAPEAARPAAPAVLPGPSTSHSSAALVAVAHPAVEENVGIEVGTPGRQGASASPTGTSTPEGTTGDADQGANGPTTPAVLLNPSKPAYPRYCIVHEEEGTVVLALEVRADGTVGSIAIASSSGNKRLDAAALEEYRKARFAPARRGGRPVPSIHRIRVVFRLKDADEAAGE